MHTDIYERQTEQRVIRGTLRHQWRVELRAEAQYRTLREDWRGYSRQQAFSALHAWSEGQTIKQEVSSAVWVMHQHLCT